MANVCDFEIHAKGAHTALAELVLDLRGKNPDDSERARHMSRIDYVDVIERIRHDDASETWHMVGSCAWSSLVCMTLADPICYGFDRETNTPRAWFIGLEEEATLRNLEIELHDSECGMEFATRIVARPNEPLRVDEFDYQEICFEEGYDDLEELERAYDLTEEEVTLLRGGECVVRTDMDMSWSI